MAEQFICSKSHPWIKPAPGSPRIPVVHVDARQVGDQEDGYPGGDIVTYHCPNCGHSWNAELAQ